MALTKNEKKDVVSEVADLLSSSKMTVVAKYEGTTVKALQQLRRDAKANGTKVKVVKNRLVIQALKGNKDLEATDTSELQGMLLYAFNGEDEVAAEENEVGGQDPRFGQQYRVDGRRHRAGVFRAADPVKRMRRRGMSAAPLPLRHAR